MSSPELNPQIRASLPEAISNLSFEDTWLREGQPRPYGLSCDGDEVHRNPDDQAITYCRTCGHPTQWYSINFGTFYCKPECLNAEWDGYWNALKATDRGDV